MMPVMVIYRAIMVPGGGGGEASGVTPMRREAIKIKIMMSRRIMMIMSKCRVGPQRCLMRFVSNSE